MELIERSNQCDAGDCTAVCFLAMVKSVNRVSRHSRFALGFCCSGGGSGTLQANAGHLGSSDD